MLSIDGITSCVNMIEFLLIIFVAWVLCGKGHKKNKNTETRKKLITKIYLTELSDLPTRFREQTKNFVIDVFYQLLAYSFLQYENMFEIFFESLYNWFI